MSQTKRLQGSIRSVLTRVGDGPAARQPLAVAQIVLSPVGMDLFARPSLAVRAEFFKDSVSRQYRFAIFGETGPALLSSTGFKGRDEAWSTLLRATAGTRGFVIHDRTTGLTHLTP